jgi:hypothetical protein
MNIVIKEVVFFLMHYINRDNSKSIKVIDSPLVII